MMDKDELADALGCGRQLRRTREKLGLSVDDVAAELRLSGFQIQALEEDDWGQLPGTTYARGYVRSYARLLGMDADQLLTGASTQEIELSRGAPEIETPRKPEPDVGQREPGPPPETAGGSAWRWLGVLAAIAVIGLAYWQYREDWALIRGVAGPPAAGVAGEAAGREVEAAAAAQDEGHGTGAAAAAAASSGGAGASPPVPRAPDRAVFQFDEQSWIEVRDAGGTRLLYRSFPAGRRVEVQGDPPFRVYVGNARGVRVEYMGEVTTPGASSGRLYARFVLGASSG